MVSAWLDFARRHVLSLAILLWLAAVFPARSATNSFARGLAAYEAHDFTGAIQAFKDETQRAPSAEAWHNLGNAEWQGGHPGPAILAWERALWINPRDAEAAASLRFGRQAAPLGELPLRWWETYSTWLPMNAWAWLAAGSFWVAAILAFVMPVILGWRRQAWSQSLAAIGFGLFLLALPGMAGVHTRARLGVVLPPATPLRQTPTQHAHILTRLAAGEVARCQYGRGNYLFIRTSAGDSGWVEKNQFQFISL